MIARSVLAAICRLRSVLFAVLIFTVGNIAFGLLQGPPGDNGVTFDSVSQTAVLYIPNLYENIAITVTNAFTALSFGILVGGAISLGLSPMAILFGLALTFKFDPPIFASTFAALACLVLLEYWGFYLWGLMSV